MTNDFLCGFAGDREAALIAYVYDDISPAERTAFESHLASCARCRSELNGLDGVREQLVRWTPPEAGFTPVARHVAAMPEHQPAWWREMPVWTQVAAAMLVFGVAAGIANLDVRYDHNGLSIRTGWSGPRTAGAPATASAANVGSTPSAGAAPTANVSTGSAPWRADLVALEQQLRNEMHVSTAAAPVVTRVAATDPDMRRVKTMVDESERRQQRELALRVAEAIRDFNVQRQADLRKIDQSLGMIQDRTGVEVLKNRQMIDYYMQRVSQRQ